MADTTTYDPSISKGKGVAGGIDGAVAAVVTALVIALVKANVKDLDPNVENGIAVGVGMVISALVIGIKKFTENWMKHKNDGKAVTPAPVPPDKIEPAPEKKDPA